MLKINSDLDANDGDYEWALQFGTEVYDQPSAIVIDDSTGYVFVTGTTTDVHGLVGKGKEGLAVCFLPNWGDDSGRCCGGVSLISLRFPSPLSNTGKRSPNLEEPEIFTQD